MTKTSLKLCFILTTIALMGLTMLPDPTRPPDSMLQPAFINATQAITLTATIVSAHEQVAIMNGTIIRKGDKVGPYIVTSINSNSVELAGPQNSKEVVTITPAVKSPAKGT